MESSRSRAVGLSHPPLRATAELLAAIPRLQLTSLTICQHFSVDTLVSATFASAQELGTATAAQFLAGVHATQAA